MLREDRVHVFSLKVHIHESATDKDKCTLIKTIVHNSDETFGYILEVEIVRRQVLSIVNIHFEYLSFIIF